MKTVKKLIIAIVLLCITIGLQAQVSNLSIQGVLRNANGTAVENGEYELTFKLYTVAEPVAMVWEETIPNVPVEGGIYSVILGAGSTPLDAAFDEPYTLGVAIEGGTELIPRAKLTSSPYALSLIGNDNIFPNSGNVGVGSASPQNKLTVQRGNGILGFEAEEEANNSSTITTTADGLKFDAGGVDKSYTFNDGDVQLENGDVQLADGNIRLGNGAFVFSNALSSPSILASLEFEETENKLSLKNETGTLQLEGDAIVLNPGNAAIQINKEGEALKLVGTDSTFISLTAQSGTNANARLGFFENDTLKLETDGQDFVIDPKGGTTRIMNTLEVGEYGSNTYTNPQIKYFKMYTSTELKYIAPGYEDETAIWAHGDINAISFKAMSDQRIKKDFKLSDGKNDLETLNQIKVTDYRHIDKVKNGSAFRKGLIAQQVESVFPEAIGLSTKYIPNVYALSSKIKTKDDHVVISLEKPHGFKRNDKVKLLVPEGVEEVIVKTVLDEFSFSISPEKIKIKDSVFVYGKEVDDFHTVDYDRVFTLAVSATQELARKVESLEKENNKLRSSSSQSIKVNQELKTEVETLNKRMKQLEGMVEGSVNY